MMQKVGGTEDAYETGQDAKGRDDRFPNGKASIEQSLLPSL